MHDSYYISWEDVSPPQARQCWWLASVWCDGSCVYLAITPLLTADQCGNISVQPRYRDVLEYADTTKQLTKQVRQWTDWTHTHKTHIHRTKEHYASKCIHKWAWAIAPTLELQTNHRRSFHNRREGPWLKAPTSTFTFKTLLRHHAKQTLTPR